MIISFEEEKQSKLQEYVRDIFQNNQWSEGKFTEQFEYDFSKMIGLKACAVSNGGSALLTILSYLDLEKGSEVIVPTNTFYATYCAIIHAGYKPVLADCSRVDLSLNLVSLKAMVTAKTKAVIVVHIGGHIAKETAEIAEFCEANQIFLVEDCAHAHGATLGGLSAGSWGIGGAFSFYSTKTIATGEGGMVVSKDQKLIDFSKAFRNYGKYKTEKGIQYHTARTPFNFRISEFTAAIGCVQMEFFRQTLSRRKAIAKKLDSLNFKTIDFNSNWESGYYKYIVFGTEHRCHSGKVYGASDQLHSILNLKGSFSNSLWCAENHSCIPIYPGHEFEKLPAEEIKLRLGL